MRHACICHRVSPKRKREYGKNLRRLETKPKKVIQKVWRLHAQGRYSEVQPRPLTLLKRYRFIYIILLLYVNDTLIASSYTKDVIVEKMRIFLFIRLFDVFLRIQIDLYDCRFI